MEPTPATAFIPLIARTNTWDEQVAVNRLRKILLSSLVSPFDSYHASALAAASWGHFQRGRYEEAVAAARKAVQATPGFSVCHMALAAPLAKLGCFEDVKATAARVLELYPTFRYNHQFAAVGCAPELAASFGEALRTASLPE